VLINKHAKIQPHTAVNASSVCLLYYCVSWIRIWGHFLRVCQK